MTGLPGLEDGRLRDREWLERRPLAKVLDALNGDGEETRVVGGAVRDLVLGLPVGEVDLATTALPEAVRRRAKASGFRTIPTGLSHGTVTVIAEGRTFETTTLREDIETDGRHAKVVFGRDFDADARRRDLTINALSLDRDGFVHDPVGGLADLAARRVRFIGDAGQRIREDYLRILRFFRFSARFGEGPLDAEGFAAAIRNRRGARPPLARAHPHGSLQARRCAARPGGRDGDGGLRLLSSRSSQAWPIRAASVGLSRPIASARSPRTPCCA